MLTETKKQKLIDNLKAYHKRYLSGSITDLDESGTRIMINHFLTDVLGFTALEEVRTEYMIKGTYADYMIQVSGKRYFLVEVKAFSLNLSENHLRQAVNYGANEGIEWALLTNGKHFNFYRIIFEKPISHRLVFSIDLTESASIKKACEDIQFMTKDCVLKKGLDTLWNKSLALTLESIAKLMLSHDVVSLVRKKINKDYDTRFDDEQIQETIHRVLSEEVKMEGIKMPKLSKKEAGPKKVEIAQPIENTPNNNDN